MVYKTLETFSVKEFISSKCYYWFYYRIVKETQVTSYSNILRKYLSLLLRRGGPVCISSLGHGRTPGAYWWGRRKSWSRGDTVGLYYPTQVFYGASYQKAVIAECVTKPCSKSVLIGVFKNPVKKREGVLFHVQAHTGVLLCDDRPHPYLRHFRTIPGLHSLSLSTHTNKPRRAKSGCCLYAPGTYSDGLSASI